MCVRLLNGFAQRLQLLTWEILHGLHVHISHSNHVLHIHALHILHSLLLGVNQTALKPSVFRFLPHWDPEGSLFRQGHCPPDLLDKDHHLHGRPPDLLDLPDLQIMSSPKCLSTSGH